jgi:hypothetical protein
VHGLHAATSKVVNSAQGSSCKLKFVHGHFVDSNRRARIRHQCGETTFFGFHRCLINTCVEKMNSI